MDLLNLQPNKINTSITSKIFLFYGPPKTWKTTVASRFPGALIAAAEQGYQMIHGVHAQPIRKWADFKEFVFALDDPKVQEKFKTIVIDTASNLYSMCETYIKNREKVQDISKLPFGKGYKLCGDEFSQVCSTIPSLGYSLVFICHADENQDDNGNVNIKPKLDKRAYAYITGLADFIIYSRKEEDEDGKIKSFAYTQLSAQTTCGGRGDEFIAPRFVFTYEELVKQVELAIQKQIKSLGYESIEEYGPNDNGMNVYKEKEEEDISSLQAEIYNLLDFETSDSTFNVIQDFIKDTLGQDRKISETDETDREKLYAIKYYLIDLRKELKIG